MSEFCCNKDYLKGRFLEKKKLYEQEVSKPESLSSIPQLRMAEGEN